MATLNFGSFILYGYEPSIEGTASNDRIYIDDSVWPNVDVFEDYMMIEAGSGDDLVSIEPPVNGYFQRYGGSSKFFDAFGDDGDDTFIIKSSSSRHFEGGIYGDDGIDVVEEDIAGDLRNWRLSQDWIFLDLTNTKKGIFLTLDDSTEAIGSGSNWFLTKDMFHGIFEPKSFQNVIDDQVITGVGKKRDLLTGGAGSDEFKFGTGFYNKGKRIVGKFADKIVDFNPIEGDQLSFVQDKFSNLSKNKAPSIGYASSKKEMKGLSKVGYNFLYIQPTGMLYYDANGSADGLGRKKDCGGLIATLAGAPEINDSLFLVVNG